MANRMAPPHSVAAQDDIGGAVVRRPFLYGEQQLKAGDVLTEEQVRHMPRNNRNALRDGNFISIYPKRAGRAGQAFVIHRGQGKYDVIEGVKINDEPLSKEDADALAGPTGLN